MAYGINNNRIRSGPLHTWCKVSTKAASRRSGITIQENCTLGPAPTCVPVEIKGSPYFKAHFEKRRQTLGIINNQRTIHLRV